MKIDPKRMTIGFVGTGTITEAVVSGLGKTGFRDTPIVLSPRSESVAARTLRQLFSGLDHAARSRPVTGFDELVGEHSTKGGLNEQVLEDFRGFGGTVALQKALGRVLTRIRHVESKLS
ncbi:hypothetical protein [Rhizobium leguminosarum]|uniref:Pyrroline-5-carboxylate reductase catalytic N-terminal domain-containing protein n=1 Tax=Rhizobium leguminosarum TaxID=384 RepID=A0A6P0B189_RHILE|nr:hypothetical protein [Rhizobium leguminosarum]MBY5437181.1 hypothetical protein [Rhizobium leguminosarum]NEI33445.1 hypothetical protein [Rhizobium leguminosarum]NEI43636.1 hypothetical protein [Rhizobium leguminosarum]